MKKLSKRSLLSAIVGVSLLVTAACGGGSDSTGADEAGEVEEKERPSSVVVGTASQGGVYYIYGGGLAQLLDRELGVSSNVEVTGGPVHNMQLVNEQEQDIGMITMGPGYEGVLGEGDWTGGETFDNVRVIFPMYTTPFHWWSLESSGVTSIEDMDGMRVGVGPSGGTSGTYLPIIHEVLGLDITPVLAGANDMVSQQLDGQLDVIGFAAGLPIPAVAEVEAQRDIHLFGIDGENRDKVLEALPYFEPYTIPADTYDQLDEDLETIAMFNFGITYSEMNADFVYELVKAYHENNDLLMTTHSSAEEAVPEAILRNEVVPLHVGAIRYYEEIGIDLPESVYPAEWENE
ncbi:TAXI family TRAP transporter solute-binding subunit [Halalkalibacterium halodurans]|uniref:TAXI family TRAP transporter solute-binding subunit n=1 Tax=Halalkalibacterium halodurans TaxID=86665 RepID=UPI002AAA2F5C|nr:TAXI family TRAP transporter solute-binding subunit [Halalkalibacterium halodurans]MDY7221096.1 TAXI family TRAP transporter solute-binding subunit [Halalkalibacterium halodurans]MDY7240335.1 TAXI family TRAP transporter solute-binding subunit [Halalkalibacterium halodurans]MED4082495.1 TAXI family TRAP transporter solute-binding subunit [Halalkalibacterium halodurans]MED4086101.1 TAXI family TRAP transporter solute-binding subunit [Halalkalibacterium halodurans]MED4106986.1 TAXI family TRA